uniref:Uncharacterized protein n=1 Tax=Vespula pensylvanica TaxID=30213 RepID=A0A834KUI5_VESPE|nr:hypothetical protein H0235_013062 [Vespula pensylvanica]
MPRFENSIGTTLTLNLYRVRERPGRNSEDQSLAKENSYLGKIVQVLLHEKCRTSSTLDIDHRFRRLNIANSNAIVDKGQRRNDPTMLD